MCGITGFINNTENTEAVLGRMMDRIRHRGPDAEKVYRQQYCPRTPKTQHN